jgi:hypothetical protein
MAGKVTVERSEGRPAFAVRVDGVLAGVIFRAGKDWRGVREGSSQPARGSFSSRDAAAKAVARMAGHHDLEAEVAQLKERRGPPGRRP